jgi:hypothetical protein
VVIDGRLLNTTELHRHRCCPSSSPRPYKRQSGSPSLLAPPPISTLWFHPRPPLARSVVAARSLGHHRLLLAAASNFGHLRPSPSPVSTPLSSPPPPLSVLLLTETSSSPNCCQLGTTRSSVHRPSLTVFTKSGSHRLSPTQVSTPP